MKIKKLQPLLEVLIISALLFIAHKLFFYWNKTNPKYQNFYFSLETIYFFFSLSSIIIVSILLFVKQKSSDNVGFTFMLTTCLKIGITLFLLMPILNSKSSDIGFEKFNFFVVFALFLSIETVVTIGILNNNQ
jgi:hypothetical protein